MPKKASKKGAGSKVSMTEEDRLLFLHQRAEAEQAIAKKKEEILTQFLKDKLQKEEKNTAVNLNKLTQQWRTVLRQTRTAELCRDNDADHQSFERVLDRKDSIVKCLVSDLNEAEQQISHAMRSHLHYGDRLLALHMHRVTCFQQQWHDDLQELGAEYNNEREDISSLHYQQLTHLKHVTFSMEQHHMEMDDNTYHDYQCKRKEIKTKHFDEKQSLVHKFTMAQLFCPTDKVQAGPVKDESTVLQSLCFNDKCRAQEVDALVEKHHKLIDSIAALRLKLIASQKERDTAVQELRATKETQQTCQQTCQTQLVQARALDRKLLITLTIQSSAAAKKLQGIISTGEKILRRAEMCSKFESEHEKVLPFYVSSLTTEEQSQAMLEATEPSMEVARAILDYADLARFWQRYNKVLLERLCLAKEKDVLTWENQQLQALLRQYMDSISVSDEILRSHNHLLIVSRHTLALAPDTERQLKQYTVIEGAHVIQHTL